eukprot:5134980-Pyramimonas_sp.AAC.1
MPDRQGATVTLVRSVDAPGMVFTHVAGSSERNSNVDSRRWSLRSCALARSMIFIRLSSTVAFPAEEKYPVTYPPICIMGNDELAETCMDNQIAGSVV